MAIRVATAPVSWGIMESVEKPPGYPFARVLDEIAEAGYTGTELGPFGFMPTEASALRRELERRGLTVCSAFVAMPLSSRAARAAGLEHVERSARLISGGGASLLVLSDEITPERDAVAGRPDEANQHSYSEDEWTAAQEAVRAVVALCAKWGLKVAFHHHLATHVETPQEVDRLLSLFSPEELGLCLDTGHCAWGGGDPVRVLEHYAGRVGHVHLKDIDAGRMEEARRQRLDFHAGVRHGVFAPLGRGQVNFSRVLSLLREQHYDGWVVAEQDVLAGGRGATTPLANASAGRAFLRGLGI